MDKNDEYIYSLIIRFLSDNTSIGENDKVIDWINESVDNQKYFNQIRDIWLASNVLKPPGNFDLMGTWSNLNKQIREWNYTNFSENKVFKIRTIDYILRIAAIVIIILGIGLLIRQNIGNSLQDNLVYDISTPLGSKTHIKLPDGTSVNINSGSILRLGNNFGKSDREVYLEGEAYFDVVKNKDKPFIVKTNYLKVRVLGTKFNVKAYKDEQTIETAVVSGKVLVEEKNKNITLLPNQKVVIEKEDFTKENKTNKPVPENSERIENQTIISIQTNDLEKITAWKDQKLIFKDETFADLAKRLNRWFGFEIIINSEELKTYKYTGKFEYNEPINQVLDIIKLTTPIEYSIKHNIVTVSLKSQK